MAFVDENNGNEQCILISSDDSDLGVSIVNSSMGNGLDIMSFTYEVE